MIYCATCEWGLVQFEIDEKYKIDNAPACWECVARWVACSNNLKSDNEKLYELVKRLDDFKRDDLGGFYAQIASNLTTIAEINNKLGYFV